jgi:serine/threonine protein kinase
MMAAERSGSSMIGEILDGKYRIDHKLGSGGMGNVYLAMHLGTTRIVAVKVIAPRWASDPHFLARFQREAQACGRLRHPNIVNVTDFGIARAVHGQVAYLVMEFLDGQTLSDFQKANPQPGLPLVADLLDQVGLALSEAHRVGIVHRDLKPDNIWLEPNGRGGYTAKVLDFGVAKLNLPGAARAPEPSEPSPLPSDVGRPAMDADEMETAVIGTAGTPLPGAAVARADDKETVLMTPAASDPSSGSFGSDASGQTMPGSLVGTPAYMSPEQALGMETDFRSDIYSLAVVAYSLVCGRLPFTGKTSELIAFHQSGSPAPPASVRKIPGDVSDAILAGLARNPADRPRTAVALTQRFHNAVDAEFLALRRSRAFLQQHLAAYFVLMIPIYSTMLSATALLGVIIRKLVPVPAVEMLAVTALAVVLFVFSDNVLRASAALIAMDEQVRVRRFLSFRVLWRLIKTMPALFVTQARSLVSVGPGWIVGDCLWPVICTVERLKGKAAIERSRQLMTGLRSAGRALAIRHLALAILAIADTIKSVGFVWQRGHVHQPNQVVTATWFPLFAIFAAAPLFLYDRTAAHQGGPLLQLNRTPEMRITARPLSLSSMIWLAAGVLYLLYQPIRIWLFGGG